MSEKTLSDVRHITVKDDDDGQRLDRWLKKNVPELPYILAQKFLRTGQIRIDGKRAKPESKLSGGQEIRIPPIKPRMRPDKPKLSDKDAAFIKSLVIYEDEHVIALNKPYGLPTQGGSKVKVHIDGMLDALADKEGVKPRLVHRLDKDTSGVLLLARSAKIARALGESFKGRDVKKIYWALTCPAPNPWTARSKRRCSRLAATTKSAWSLTKKRANSPSQILSCSKTHTKAPPSLPFGRARAVPTRSAFTPS